MSVECHYTYCRFHPKDEPFCHEQDCLASPSDLEVFSETRDKEEKLWGLEKENAELKDNLSAYKRELEDVKHDQQVNDSTNTDIIRDKNKEIAELRGKVTQHQEVLCELIALKSHKTIYGKDDYYRENRPKAWDKADEVMKRN